MSYSGGKITAPVTMGDVQAAVSLGSTDLATLITSGTINCWAKYKPVVKNLIDTVNGQWDSANNKWKNSATWWKGSGNNTIGGITPFQTSVRSTLLSKYDGGMNGWTYTRPAGGANQPYRLQDFAGYNKNANPPVSGFWMPDQTIQDGRLHADAMMSFTEITGADFLTLADFISDSFPNGLYFGIMMVYSGSIALVVTADTINTSTIDADFSGSGNMLPLGRTYDVYPILCRDRIPITQTQEQPNSYLSCPGLSPVRTTIVDRSSTVDVNIEVVYNLIHSNRATVRIVNESGQTITNVYYFVNQSSVHPSSGGTSVGTIANGSQYDVLNLSYPSGSYFHVSFTYQGATYWKTHQLMDT